MTDRVVVGESMARLYRWPIFAMVPINILLVGWVWIGRLTFGVAGWLIFLMIPVAGLVGIALLISTILAMTGHQGRPWGLDAGQLHAQLLTWGGLLGFGAFLPDYGDQADSNVSLLTNTFGYSEALMLVSWLITFAFALTALVGYILLVVGLVQARRRPAVTVA